MSIRVLVADDQSMVRAGFRMLLTGEQDIEVGVAEASNGLEAIAMTERFDPAVVLMDIQMPEVASCEVPSAACGDAMCRCSITPG